MRRLRTILQSRYLWKVVTFFCLIYAFFMICFYPFKSHYSEKTQEIIGSITKYKIDGDLLTVHLKEKETVIIYYYFKTEKEKLFYEQELKLGDQLKVKGIFQKPTKNTIPNLFNYQKYLMYHKIFYVVTASTIQKMQNNTSIFYHVKNLVIKRTNQIDATGYLRTFILGDKSILDPKTINTYQKNGITHLFSISGMHVSLLVGIILFFLNKISYHNFYKYSIVILLLLFYLFLTDCSASIFRTTIMFILAAVSKCLNLKIKKMDIMFLTLAIAILINPFILCDIGFQFSYFISFTLVLLYSKINQMKNKFIKTLYISYICFLVSFPICVYHFSQVNFLSIFLNIIMIPFVSMIVFPMTFVTFLFPICYPVYSTIIFVLEKVNIMVGQIKCFEMILMRPSIIIILGYYFVIGLTLFNKKFLLVLGSLIMIHRIFPLVDYNFIFTMLDVGQGDCLLIQLPKNAGTILVDTGGIIQKEKEIWQERKSDFGIISNKIIHYLKSLGIYNIDYLVITHGDYDYMGEAINLVSQFKVGKVIFNCGEYNELEKELIKVLDKKKIKYYSCVKKLNIDKYQLQFLNTKVYDDENENSNVIYFNYNNYKFLFMGDAGTIKEKDILEKYNIKDIDFLKVGHHGSSTSSSKEFIERINPKYSFISVGKNNRYGHPKDSVLDTLSNSKIYRTDIDGSIEIKLSKNDYNVSTCPP